MEFGDGIQKDKGCWGGWGVSSADVIHANPGSWVVDAEEGP